MGRAKMATSLSLLVFAACLSQCTVQGFFYSTGYYPFGHYAPTVGYPFTHHTLPTTHHVLPAVSYSGCRNVHGALVPCAFPTPFLTAVAAPAAAVEPVAEAPEEEAADADADPYLLYGYGAHHAYPYHHVPYLGLGLGHHLPYLHGYYAHTGCKNYLGATVPCL